MRRWTKARGAAVAIVASVVAIGVVAAVWGLTVPRAVVTIVAIQLIAYAVTESASGPSERPARMWAQDESGQGG